MGKLLFENDNGEVNEVKISSVKSKGIAAGDVVLATYEVGDVPEEQKHLVTSELLRLKAMLEQAFPEGTKIMVAASKNGIEDVTFKIIKDNTK